MASLIDKTKAAIGMDKTAKEITLAGREVHTTGYGLMGLTWAVYGAPPSHEASFAAMKAALDSRANFWNGGEFYGTPDANSLHLLKAYFEKYPEDKEKVVVSIKGGTKPGQMVPDGGEANVRRSVEECLKFLEPVGKRLDLFECARVDPKTPVEVTMRVLKALKEEGKVGGVCLSECSADTIRRAAKVVKVEGVEVEFSLWSTEILDNGVAEACAELDIPIIAYSPLGRGFLTGQIKSIDDLAADDFRRHSPRFSPENFDKNLKLVAEIEGMAKRKGVTPGQIGLAWMKKMGEQEGMPRMLPIPGSTNPERVRENAVEVELSAEDMKEIDSVLKSFVVVGGRYPEAAAHLSFGDSPAEE